jgi:hypothetical protein
MRMVRVETETGAIPFRKEEDSPWQFGTFHTYKEMLFTEKTLDADKKQL